MADNIVHLVLARIPDAPPGTKGISCFIVPKFLVNDDGSLGERNDVTCVSIEHKMGIKASPTCVMSYGEQGDGAVGYLIGEENQGMRYMFTMMNNARLVGRARGPGPRRAGLPGRPAVRPGAPAGPGARRSGRRDVAHRRAARRAAHAAHHEGPHRRHAGDHLHQRPGHRHRRATTPTPTSATRGQELVELLTPVSKGFGTDMGIEVTSLAIQVYGGMGYIEESGVPSTSATPASPPSTRAPTASRPWTSSAASCRCAAAAWWPTSCRRSPPSTTTWRPRATISPWCASQLAVGALGGAGDHRLADRARASPMCATRWPAPPRSCACSACSSAARYLAEAALAAERPTWPRASVTPSTSGPGS